MYQFKTEPLKHQLTCFEASKDLPEYALLADMGTGKSKITVDTVAYLFSTGQVDKWLCLAPNGIYKNWPNEEVPKHWPDDLYYEGSIWKEKDKRTNIPVQRRAQRDLKHSIKILFMNIEALQYKKGQDAAKAFVDGRTIITVDESTTIKSTKAKRSKFVIDLGKKSKYRRILSGYPSPNSQADLYMQFNFLNPDIFGYRSFFAFRKQYCVMKTIDLGPGRPKFDKIIGPRNTEELREKMAPYSFRIKKSECLDLPPKIYQTRHVEMSENQKRVYGDIKRDAISILGAEKIVTVDLVLTQLIRLHQICCGFIKDDMGGVEELDNPKLSEIKSILEETSDKVIVWANYVHNIHQLKKELSNEYGDEDVVTYYGGSNQRERDEAIERFQRGTAKIFIANPATAGFGLTLTASSTSIYFSNSYNLEHRLQSEDRNHRIGQTGSSVLYVDLIIPGTVDEKITRALINKKKIGDNILGDEWREWIG